MLGLYAESIFAKPIKMKFVFSCYLLLISAAAIAQPAPNAENIFIITTDGFRWQEVFTGADSDLISNPRYVEDTSLLKQLYWDSTAELRRQKLMPFLWNIVAQQGQLYGNRLYENKVDVANFYKISYPGYNEMFTGYPDPVFIPNIPVYNRNANIFEYLNAKKEYAGKVAVFSSWNIFSAILNKRRTHLPVNSGYENLPDDSSYNNEMINVSQDLIVHKKNTRYDLLTYLSAREYIEHNQPKVVLIGFGETDEYAHGKRYDLYLQQAANVDKMIAELWYYVQTNPFYRNKTAFIITTDHGRGKNPNAWYKHGILTKGSGETWFAVIGPGISKEGEIKSGQQNYQKQMASTIASLLGEEFDSQKNNADPIFIPITTGYNTALLRQPK
jgi:Type I phosphodiesterase / nucleotide pyrophosphatase